MGMRVFFRDPLVDALIIPEPLEHKSHFIRSDLVFAIQYQFIWIIFIIENVNRWDFQVGYFCWLTHCKWTRRERGNSLMASNWNETESLFNWLATRLSVQRKGKRATSSGDDRKEEKITCHYLDNVLDKSSKSTVARKSKLNWTELDTGNIDDEIWIVEQGIWRRRRQTTERRLSENKHLPIFMSLDGSNLISSISKGK